MLKILKNPMIRKAKKSDIKLMVEFSYQKRLSYAKAQPNFWKMAENSNEIQVKWFEKLLQEKNTIALICNKKQGFIIGNVITPPEVYDAGLTLMIDDFCVKSENLWLTTGKELLEKCQKKAKDMGVKQILVVCGNHDQEKSLFLKSQNLNIASNWFTKIT